MTHKRFGKVLVILAFSNLLWGCNIKDDSSSTSILTNNTTQSQSSPWDKGESDFEKRLIGDNPVDQFFLDLFDGHFYPEVEYRTYQDAYYEVWKELYQKELEKLKSECVDKVYEKEMDRYNEALENYLNTFNDNNYSIILTVWAENYKRPIELWTSGGNGTSSGILFEKALIYKNAFMQLIRDPEYAYPDLEEWYNEYLETME